MKIKNQFTILLLSLLLVCGFGSLMFTFANGTTPTVQTKTNSAADGTNFNLQLLAGTPTHIRLLVASLKNQRMSMEVIANNIANTDVIGFKAGQMRFQDSTSGLEGQTTLLKGATAVGITRLFTQGKLEHTGNDFDFAIQGNGFFVVQTPDGTLAYTRDGGFRKDSTGRIVTGQGYPVQGGFEPVPAGATCIRILERGQATYSTASGTTTFQLQLARFANPNDLNPIGGSLFLPTAATGTPELGNPGENGFGELQQGFIELSNVDVHEEMANLCLAAQAYHVTAEALRVAENLLLQGNNLQRP